MKIVLITKYQNNINQFKDDDMKTKTLNLQNEFEYKVCNIFKFNQSNSMIIQSDERTKMIIDGFSGENSLSGTLAYNRQNKSFLAVVTFDSNVNHIENITLKMIKILIKEFCGSINNKVILATNIPIEIHSHKIKDLKKDFNFHIKTIGFSFCQKHNLDFRMY